MLLYTSSIVQKGHDGRTTSSINKAPTPETSESKTSSICRCPLPRWLWQAAGTRGQRDEKHVLSTACAHFTLHGVHTLSFHGFHVYDVVPFHEWIHLRVSSGRRSSGLVPYPRPGFLSLQERKRDTMFNSSILITYYGMTCQRLQDVPHRTSGNSDSTRASVPTSG